MSLPSAVPHDLVVIVEQGKATVGDLMVMVTPGETDSVLASGKGIAVTVPNDEFVALKDSPDILWKLQLNASE